MIVDVIRPDMDIADYRRFYIDFVVTILGPSVKREATCDIKLAADVARQEVYENQKNGLVILALVSLIEANFLTKAQLKELRGFSASPSGVPVAINPLHLASFVYIRDCFAHSPFAKLLPSGPNTSAFLAAVRSRAFPWASSTGSDIRVIPAGLHELHLIVLCFFGEAV